MKTDSAEAREGEIKVFEMDYLVNKRGLKLCCRLEYSRKCHFSVCSALYIF